MRSSQGQPRRIARARARAEIADSSLPAETTDGRRVRVLVNAATPAELRAGLAAGAEGVGLIRTELAFLDAPAWPTRAHHMHMLAPLIAGLGGRTATVRVLDFGGDKTPPFLRGEPRRGIELLLATPVRSRAQLRAIAAAGRRLRPARPAADGRTPGEVERDPRDPRHARCECRARRDDRTARGGGGRS